jgi:hypothetical protein
MVFQVGFIALLFSQSYTLYTSPEQWAFISNVNLIFHEAGHIIFHVGGDVLRVAGGGLAEVLIPMVVAIHFLQQHQRFSFGFALWWLSTALFSVGVYASDAQERALPLITGDPNSHDWWWLLRRFNLLAYDDAIGNGFFFASFLVLSCSLMVFSLYLWSSYAQRLLAAISTTHLRR